MKDHLIQLLDYELWANQRIIESLDTLNSPPARAIAVMGHILSAQHVWFGRVMHATTFVTIWEDIPVSWMIETAERQHRQIVSHVHALNDSELFELVEYVNTKDMRYKSSLLDILTHLSHHAAYHRGQVVQLIRPMLNEAPVTDFIVFTRENQRVK
ncbi:DinB family protein [Spirosoma pollinicola]|uniref:Damage-inducible protein DinB n=1 Tax=Spirosoma pollinicola TaxID=2057025 RepID=A0A2K8Z6K0_9BACT|nr:DinB family protein [Spirosoma pollinicola]AUD05490.1 damage-inducible protein DinB [Spirosoma pollinicola]